MSPALASTASTAAGVKIDELMTELRPVLTRWRDERFPRERLGDWVERVLWKEQPTPVTAPAV